MLDLVVFLEICDVITTLTASNLSQSNDTDENQRSWIDHKVKIFSSTEVANPI